MTDCAFAVGDEVTVCEIVRGENRPIYRARIQTVGKKFIRLRGGTPNAWRVDGMRAEPARFGWHMRRIIPTTDEHRALTVLAS